MQGFQDSLFEVSGVADPNMILNVTVPETVQKQVEEWQRGTRAPLYSRTPSPHDWGLDACIAGYAGAVSCLEAECEDSYDLLQSAFLGGDGGFALHENGPTECDVKDKFDGPASETSACPDYVTVIRNTNTTSPGGQLIPDHGCNPAASLIHQSQCYPESPERRSPNDHTASCRCVPSKTGSVCHCVAEPRQRPPSCPPSDPSRKRARSSSSSVSRKTSSKSLALSANVKDHEDTDKTSRHLTLRHPPFFTKTMKTLWSPPVPVSEALTVTDQDRTISSRNGVKHKRQSSNSATKSQRHGAQDGSGHRVTNSGDLASVIINSESGHLSRSFDSTARGPSTHMYRSSHLPFSPPMLSCANQHDGVGKVNPFSPTAPSAESGRRGGTRWGKGRGDWQSEADLAAMRLQSEMDSGPRAAQTPPHLPDRRLRSQANSRSGSRVRTRSTDASAPLVSSLPRPCLLRNELNASPSFVNSTHPRQVDDITALSVEETVDFFLNMTSPMTRSDQTDSAADWSHFNGFLHMQRTAHARFSL